MSTFRRFAVATLVLLAFGVALFLAARAARDGDAPGVRLVPTAPPAESARAPRVHARVETTVPVPPGSIRVLVTSLDGTPVPGARVMLFRDPGGETVHGLLRPSVDSPTPERVAESGSNMFEDVPAGRWYVAAEAPGFARHVIATATRAADDSGIEARLALAEPQKFTGRVFDPDGAPAADVTVILAPTGLGERPSDVACLRAQTDETGAWSFSAVETGRHALWFAPRPGVVLYETDVLIPSLDGFDIHMVRGARVEGTVRDADTGAPIAGARVRQLASHHYDFDPWSEGGVSNVHGRFEISTWQRRVGRLLLLVDAAGYVELPENEQSRFTTLGPLADGQRFSIGEVRIRRGARIEGTVRGSGGPIAGFRVSVGNGMSAATDTSGRYAIDRIAPGRVTVVIHPDATGLGRIEEAEVALIAGASVIHDIELSSESHRVRRRVVDGQGRPVGGAVLVATIGRFRTSATSDSNGWLEMDADFIGGVTSLTISRSEFVRSVVTLRKDDTGDLPRLFRDELIAGEVVDSDGSPVRGVRVTLVGGFDARAHGFFAEWGAATEGVSSADGSFHIPRPSEDFLVKSSRGTALDRRSGAPLRIRVAPPIRVTGTVSGSGAPLRGAIVRNSAQVAVARTDASGRFDFEWPFAATSFHVTATGWHSAAIAPGALVSLTPERALRGTVHRPDGSVAAGFVVDAWGPGSKLTGGWSEERGAWSKTASLVDADGRFVIPRLGANPYEVLVIDPDRVFAGHLVTATAGGPELAIVPREGATLTIDVVDADGKPELAFVRAIGEAGVASGDEGRSDENGRVNLRVLPGATYTIRVEGGGTRSVEVTDVRAGAEPLKVVLVEEK